MRFSPSVHLKILACFQKTGFRSLVVSHMLHMRKVPSLKLGGDNLSIFHNCSISFLLRRNSTLQRLCRPRGTKTVAKAVVDAKIQFLRIPAGDWKKIPSLLLKIEGICRLKNATKSLV